MNLLTLNKANQILQKIKEYEAALECFETKYGAHNEYTYDRTPKIILNVDDLEGGRENMDLPMILSDEMIDFLKKEIVENLNKAKIEFEDL